MNKIIENRSYTDYAYQEANVDVTCGMALHIQDCDVVPNRLINCKPEAISWAFQIRINMLLLEAFLILREKLNNKCTD